MNRKMIKFVVSVMFLVGVSTVMCCAAQMTVKATSVEGTVEMMSGDAGAWVAVKSGDTVPVGNTLRTKAASSCMLAWADGNAVKVSALSVLVVSNAERGADGSEKSSLNLKEGKVFAHVKKLQTGESKFELKTPTAVAGVRGTDLYGTMEGGSSSFGVVEGSVAVEAGGVEVMLDPGFSVAIDISGAMSDIVPIPEDIKQEVNQNIQQVRQEAKAEVKSEAKQEKKEEKKEAKEEKKEEKTEKKEEVKAEKQETKQETKSEEKTDAAPVADEKPSADTPEATSVPSDDITDTVSGNVEQVLDDEVINSANDDIERIYRTGTVDVDIYIGD